MPAKALFGGIARLRGKRAFHPDGFATEARVESLGHPEMAGTELFERPGTHDGVVRWSRATGIPQPLPDWLGFALRVRDAYGSGRHQDFLLVSSLSFPIARHILVPGLGGFAGATYTSILVYDIAGRTRLIAARDERLRRSSSELGEWREEAPGSRFELVVGTSTGAWSPFARAEIGAVIPDEEAEALRLDPWNTGGAIRPSGPFQGLRAPAYEGSVAGRRA